MSKDGRISKLMAYAGSHRRLTYASLALSGISSALSVVPFYYIWLMLDEVLEVAPDYSQAVNLVHNGWMALGFTVSSALIYIAGLMCSHIAAFRIAKNIRKKTIAHATTLPPGAFDMIGSGKVRRVVQDSAGATETYLAHQMPDMVGSAVLPVAILIMLFVFDWRLGVASIIPVVLSFLAMWTMVGSKVLQEHMETYQGALGDMNREAVEYVRGISVVKTFQQTIDSFRNFKTSIETYQKFVVMYTVWCRSRMVFFVIASDLAFATLILFALWIQGGLVWTDGFLLDFMFYVIFTPLISVLLMRILMASNEGYIVDDALSRIEEILSMEPLPEPFEPKEPADMTVRFVNVTFTYPDAERPAVDGVSFEMRPGTVTALVGPSGSGKSTVASLACRFWDPQSGSIEVGGVDLRDVGTRRLGQLTSSVFQVNNLFKNTLANNVRLSRPDATDEEVMEALRQAQCDDIVAKLPSGLNTMMGPEGMYLSGGETQRIAIARAMLKDSPIVILDEATAFADPENEYLVQRAFDSLAENKTVLMIAHRLTTVRNADNICVMDEGRIVESGTHHELIARGGMYAKMWGEYQRSLSWKIEGVTQ